MKTKKRYCILLVIGLVWLVARKLRLLVRHDTLPATRLHSYIDMDDIAQIERDLIFDEEEVDYANCRMETCFNFDRCTTFKVYVYPMEDGVVSSNSYHKIIQSVKDSGYYTTNPLEACLFVLSLDTLDRDHLSQDYIRNMQFRVENLEHWNNGENHLIFNLYSGTWPQYTEDLGFDIGKAILAKASIAILNYRPQFDISLPLFHRTHPEKGGEPGFLKSTIFPGVHQYFLAFKGKRYVHGIGSETRNSLYHLHNGRDLALVTTCKHGKNWREMQDDRCEMDNEEYDKWDYMNLLSNSTFCLVPRGRRLGSFRFLETLQAGCVPVILSNSWQLPFGEVIDWASATISIDERQLLQVPEILRTLPQPKIFKMRQQTQIFWDLYLSSVRKIVFTTLEIIKQRVFPHTAATSSAWNSRPGVFFRQQVTHTPKLAAISGHEATENSPMKFAKNGAKIAANDSLPAPLPPVCAVISTVSQVPVASSTSQIFVNVHHAAHLPAVEEVIVVWRSNSTPPPLRDWYRFGNVRSDAVTISLISSPHIRMDKFKVAAENCASENVLMLDDDVTISTEELQFTHSVFKDFPNRLVGFTTGLHYWDEDARTWRYSSRVTSQFSMISTQVALLSKQYAVIFNQFLPRKTVDYLVQFPQCEDLLFNFLVAHVGKNAPIKVAQRRRMSYKNTPNKAIRVREFKEKQNCMIRFVEDFGEMPLINSQVRMDPVLFKDPVSNLRKKYRKMESLA